MGTWMHRGTSNCGVISTGQRAAKVVWHNFGQLWPRRLPNCLKRQIHSGRTFDLLEDEIPEWLSQTTVVQNPDRLEKLVAAVGTAVQSVSRRSALTWARIFLAQG